MGAEGAVSESGDDVTGSGLGSKEPKSGMDVASQGLHMPITG